MSSFDIAYAAYAAVMDRLNQVEEVYDAAYAASIRASTYCQARAAASAAARSFIVAVEAEAYAAWRAASDTARAAE